MTPPGFQTDLLVKCISDSANSGRGLWELVEPLVFVARDQRIFAVPAGFTTNFADQPSPWSLPRAAILHDWLIRFAVVPRKEADDLFYEAMQLSGIPSRWASFAHVAVRSYTASLEADGPEGKGFDIFNLQER